jgi:phosphatidylinositol phospholipase C gamma-1
MIGCTVRAQFAYRAAQKDELSFPINAIITEVEKRDGGWWMGAYGEMKGWLPSNYVTELVPEVENDLELEDGEAEDGGNPLGELQKSFMGVDGLHVEPRASTKDQRLIFRIRGSVLTEKPLDVGAENEEDMKSWAIAIDQAAAMHAAKTQSTGKQEKSKQEKGMKIAAMLSDLIFYCTSVKWESWASSKEGGYQLMSSFGEKTALELTSKKKEHATNLVAYCMRNFSRVYPKGTRVNSSNFDPQVMWNCGMQLVALNYQTPDRPMWINTGKFRPNANCGYVLKPAALLDEEHKFDPYDSNTWTKRVSPITMKLRILSARHLVKPGKGVASPYVNVEVSGVDADSSGNERRTKIIQDNGFRPYWNESKVLEISMPELACISFTVYDEDMFGDSNAIGQAVLPIGTKAEPLLRTGYRSVQLQNTSCCGQDLSALLVHINIEYGATKHSEALLTLRESLQAKKEDKKDLISVRMHALQAHENTSGSDAKLERLTREIDELKSKIVQLNKVAGTEFVSGSK